MRWSFQFWSDGASNEMGEPWHIGSSLNLLSRATTAAVWRQNCQIENLQIVAHWARLSRQNCWRDFFVWLMSTAGPLFPIQVLTVVKSSSWWACAGVKRALCFAASFAAVNCRNGRGNGWTPCGIRRSLQIGGGGLNPEFEKPKWILLSLQYIRTGKKEFLNLESVLTLHIDPQNLKITM